MTNGPALFREINTHILSDERLSLFFRQLDDPAFETKPFTDLDTMKAEVNVQDVALLGLCDRLGRGTVNRREEEQTVQLFLKKAAGPGPDRDFMLCASSRLAFFIRQLCNGKLLFNFRVLRYNTRKGGDMNENQRCNYGASQVS